MHDPDINVYAGARQAAEAFAVFLAYWLRMEDRATIALSGGGTPKLLFQLLAGEYRTRIDWSKVHFFWGDERCVPPSDPESNFGMTRELLLAPLAIPEANIHRIRGEADPAAEARRYGEEIEALVTQVDGRPAFDLIMLGLGEDGHTASIFPGQLHLLDDAGTCAVARHPGSGQTRITLTGPVLNNARQVAFLVTGGGKAGPVREILRREGDWASYPAAFIQPDRGQVYWFLDEAAAAGL